MSDASDPDAAPRDASGSAEPPSAVADPGRLGRRYLTLVVGGVSLVALTCLTFLLPSPYVTMRPGVAFDTFGDISGEPMFTFGKDVKTYPVDGSLDFTTVSVTRAGTTMSLAEVARAYFTDDVAVVPRDIVYPDGESEEDSQSAGQAQLTSSKDSSRVVALRAAGYDVGEKPVVAQVVDDGAAQGVLEPDDVVLAVDGKTVDSSQAVVDAVGSVAPGDVVTMRIERDGKDQDVELTTKADPDDPTVPRVGISVATSYDFPIEVENHVGEQVGGSSAGTMFALAIYDKLTPGSLTGGREIAGTGTMSPDGTVGEIGGVRQKIAGAAASGAEIFLVPDANCSEALAGDDHGLQLVRIATFDEAVSDLEALAADPDAKVRSCQ